MNQHTPRQASVSHWRDVCRSKARSGHIKRADLGGASGDSQSFEAAFSNLANAYLKDKAPQLIDHMLGFQLLEKNEDNDRAVGVFGFKVGPQLIYAPVFFLNGELRGHELMYLKESDTFVPMKENWVNYILNRKPNVIGEEVGQGLGQLGISRPSLNQFRESPGKYASDNWLGQGMPGLMASLGSATRPEPKVPELLKTSAFASMAFLNLLDGYPTLAKPIVQHYGKDIVKQAIKTAGTVLTAVPIEPAQKKRTVKTGSIWETKTELDKAREADPIKTGSLKIWVYDGTSGCRRGLSEKQAEQLERDGVYIKDDRYDTSKAYKVQEPMALQNPDETGHYDILCKPDSFEKCLYIHAPHGKRGRKPNGVLVRIGDGDKAWTETHPGAIFAIEKYAGREYNDWFNDLPNADSGLTVGATYVLLTPTGAGTTVFEVESSEPAEGDEKCYAVWWRNHYGARRPDHLPPVAERCYEYDNDCEGADHIVINRYKGKKFVARLNSLYVPPGAKALKIKDPPKSEDGCCNPSVGCCGESDSSDPPALRPGNHVDLQLGLYKTSAELVVMNNGTEAVVNGSRSTPKGALLSLVRQYGLREKAARDLLKEAQVKRGVKCRIKLAAPYDLIASAPSAPSFPEQEISSDFFFGSDLPATYGQEEEFPVPGLEGMPMNQRPLMNEPPEPMLAQQVMQAASTGQKEVLDTSLLSNLLKGTQNDTLIDRHLPDLMKGLDSLGRLLFNLYWHHDKFEDRYGSNNLPELEDAMRNSFESMGDVTLELKQKTVEPYPDEAVDVNFGEGEI